jgi:hypothetical protein
MLRLFILEEHPALTSVEIDFLIAEVYELIWCLKLPAKPDDGSVNGFWFQSKVIEIALIQSLKMI